MPAPYDDLDDLVGALDDDDLLGDEDDDLLGDEDDDLLGDEDDDLLGDADELGDILDLVAGEDDEEVGARRRRTRRARALKRLRRARARRSHAPAPRAEPRHRVHVVRPSEPSARGPRSAQPLGGTATQGAVAGQLLVSTTVQETVRVERLFVVGRDALGAVLDPGSYSIGDIKVGTKSQFSALPPLPGVMFQATATSAGAAFAFDAIQAGTDFTVVIADAPAASTFVWGALAVPA